MHVCGGKKEGGGDAGMKPVKASIVITMPAA